MTVHCNPSSLTNWKTNEIISSSVLCRQEVVLQLSASSKLIVMAHRTNSLECLQPATGTKARILWLLQRVEVTFSKKYNRAINSILWCAEHWNNPTQKFQCPLWLFQLTCEPLCAIVSNIQLRKKLNSNINVLQLSVTMTKCSCTELSHLFSDLYLALRCIFL